MKVNKTYRKTPTRCLMSELLDNNDKYHSLLFVSQ